MTNIIENQQYEKKKHAWWLSKLPEMEIMSSAIFFLALSQMFKNIPNPMKPSHGERPGNLRGTIFVGNPSAKSTRALKPYKAKTESVGNARCVPPKEFH